MGKSIKKHSDFFKVYIISIFDKQVIKFNIFVIFIVLIYSILSILEILSIVQLYSDLWFRAGALVALFVLFPTKRVNFLVGKEGVVLNQFLFSWDNIDYCEVKEINEHNEFSHFLEMEINKKKITGYISINESLDILKLLEKYCSEYKLYQET
ncbi:hypothetical protein [Vulcanibacillus modesticaldus]|uniref:hypothetical protein n=1 Tax=Vulcanibacillus modesticaldus TaxID=337097 RepID=UPI00114CC613|nr:hypothetical protein [Vulcanibacillus modesticaldus]